MARVKIQVPIDPEPKKAEDTHLQKKSTNTRGRSWQRALIVLVVLLLVAFVVNLIDERNQLRQQVAGVTDDITEVQHIVDKLSASVELPEGETPQSSIIEDASTFAQQNPSLADIQDGDQLLFFPESQKVLVYRPSTGKVVVLITLSQQSSETP